MNQGEKKYSYFKSFNTSTFLAAKEILKSMPAFFNKVYFSSKYSRALYSGDIEEVFTNVTVLANQADMTILRQIVKNNTLYLSDWDSLKFTNNEEYGFTFIAGNIKYIVIPYAEIDGGYVMRCYDVDSGNCYETTQYCDKTYFLSSTMKENGDFVRIADFNLEYMTSENTRVALAPRKAQENNIATITSSGGFVLSNTLALLLLAISSIATVMISCYVASGGLG